MKFFDDAEQYQILIHAEGCRIQTNTTVHAQGSLQPLIVIFQLFILLGQQCIG